MYSDNVYTIADLFFFTRLLGNTLSLSLFLPSLQQVF